MFHSKTIVIVDDEQTITRQLKLQLTQAFACNVVTFNDSLAAYAHLQSFQADAISIDHRMPFMTGMGLIQLLRTVPNPNLSTPVITLTAYVDETETPQAHCLNDVYFLDKSIEEDRYLRWMKMMLFGAKANAPEAELAAYR